MNPRSVMDLDEWRQKAVEGTPPADVILRKHYLPDQVKAAADSRRVTFTISTGAVDRQGDTIAVDGWQLDNFLRNPVVLFAHRYDQLPVAKAISIIKGPGVLKATAEFPEEGLYPLADTVFQMLKGGFLRATSVGFRPIKAAPNEDRPGFAMDFLEQELLEFSVVPVPANPEALMDTAKSMTGALAAGIDITPIEQAIALARSVSKDFGTQPVVELKVDTTEVKAEIAAALEIVEKAGRTFSAANAKRIQGAHDAVAAAAGQLKELVDQIATSDDEDEDEYEEIETDAAPTKSVEPDPAPTSEESTVTVKDLADAFSAALSKAMDAASSGEGANA